MPEKAIGTGRLDTTHQNGTRFDAREKVTGTAAYTADLVPAGAFYAKIVGSTHAHAKIKNIDVSGARAVPGVIAALTGADYTFLTGPAIMDRPVLAHGAVRYSGEPVALVVAESMAAAARAALMVKAEYEPLEPVLSAFGALSPGSGLLHGDMAGYKLASKDIYPEYGTNICDRKKIRKGDIEKGFSESGAIAEERFSLPQSGLAAMETRAVSAKIGRDGVVCIRSSTQAPFVVRTMLSSIFGIPESRITVQTPYVGGGFGGKTCVFLEPLAYLASLAAGGREVFIVSSREDDMSALPCRMGLEAEIKLGASKDGRLRAARMIFLLDTGAYAEAGPHIIKAIAADCTGPYDIANVHCDCLCVYTNHTPVTAFRGFGHLELTFCIERAMDELARKLGIAPARLREINAIKPGAWSPGAVRIGENEIGDLPACIERVKELIRWDEGVLVRTGGGIIRAKGLACFWKSPAPPKDAVSGAAVTFGSDGSVNLNCGCVEIGPSMKTTAARILADKLRVDIGRISVNMDVNTSYSPEHWETAASLTTYMLGIAVARAAEDARRQILTLASDLLGRPVEDLEFCGETVRLKYDNSVFVATKEFARKTAGRGVFSFKGISPPDRETGAGRTGPHRTVGAQAVEIEFDERECTYRLIRASSVIDAGRLIDPAMAAAVVRGGMNMGLSIATRESLLFGNAGELLNTSFRTYKVMRFGQTPEYNAEFIETSGEPAPYGSRGLGEHGIIGVPAALCSALSAASGVGLNTLPLTPEAVFYACKSAKGEGNG